jgi:hypothetical protein
MALLDFLTNGAAIPPGSGVIDKTTTNPLPDWYTNYATDLLSKQNSVLNTDYAKAPGPRIAELTPDQQAAFDATRLGATAGTTALNNAVTATGNIKPGGLTAAQPYLNSASGSSVSNINDYMNPYTQNVVDRMGDLAQRTLQEKLLPTVNDSFISAGQAGSSRNAEMLGRALRDTSESTTAAQLGALQQGYTDALGTSGTDKTRAANLASTAGNLGGTDTTSALSAANQLGSLSQDQQNMALKGAGALNTIGGQQRDVNQQNLDQVLKDFMAQKGYKQDQIDKALGTFKEAKIGTPTTSNESGVTPVSSQGYQPSGLSQATSAATGILGLIDAYNKAFPG